MAFRQFKPDEWVSELDSGLEFRRKFGLESVWGELEAIYYNVHKSMANDGPNLIMATGDSLLSSLTVPNPKILVTPEQPEAVSRAPYVESIDNVLLKQLQVDDEVDTAAIHAYLFGNGIVKIGYDSEYGFDPSLDVGGALQMGFTLSQLADDSSRRIEHDSGVIPGMPWIKAVPPHDIVVPWGTLRLSNCPWIAHRFVRQIDDLKADAKYSNTGRISPTLSMEDFVRSYNSTIRLWRGTPARSSQGKLSQRFSVTDRGSREVQFVELYEIHDRRTGRILVVAPDHPSFLRNEINALQINNRLPFASISFTPKSRSFWTTPDAYYLHAIQMETSDLAVQRTKMRRISVLKFLYDKDVINDEQLQKILSPEVGAAAEIEAGGDISKAIVPLSIHPDQTLILEEEHLRRNAREQIGFSRNQQGEFTGGRKTATEAKIVDASSARRIGRRGKSVKKFYQDIITTINGIIFTHWTQPRLVEVVGEQTAQEWVQMSGTDLKSRYSYDVTFTDEEESRSRKIEALQLYSMLIQDPSIDPVALRQYLASQYNDPEFARLFNAEIQNAMRALRISGDLVEPQRNSSRGGQRGGSGLSSLRGSNVQGFGGFAGNGSDLA